MTRTTVAHLFSSVNGVVENPHLWQFDAFGPEEGEAMGAAIAPVTDVIIGRKLWEEWSEYWPAAQPDDPFAQWINAVPKHVVSSTLSGDLPWNSTAIDGDGGYLRDLRATGDGQISIAGGIEPSAPCSRRGRRHAHPDDPSGQARTPPVRDDVRSPGWRWSTRSPPGSNAMLTYALRPTHDRPGSDGPSTVRPPRARPPEPGGRRSPSALGPADLPGVLVMVRHLCRSTAAARLSTRRSRWPSSRCA